MKSAGLAQSLKPQTFRGQETPSRSSFRTSTKWNWHHRYKYKIKCLVKENEEKVETFEFNDQNTPSHNSNSEFDGEDWFNAYKHKESWFLGTYNVRGCAQAPKRIIINNWAKQWNILILGLQESKINVNSKVLTEDYVWLFSSSVSNENRMKIQALRDENKKIDHTSKNAAQEHLGVGIMIAKHIFSAISIVVPISSRIIWCKLIATPNWNCIVAYAPQACLGDHIKDEFYKQLHEVWDSLPNEEVKVILGDMNAKLLQPEPDLKQHIGPFPLRGEGMSPAELADHVQDNRQRLIDFCVQHDACIVNTMFQKPNRKTITRVRPGFILDNSEVSAHNCDQDDFIIVSNRWKNSFLDAESDIDGIKGSDHFPVWAKCLTKFRKHSKKQELEPKLPRVATKEEKVAFNEHIKHNTEDTDWDEKVRTAAKQTIAAPTQKAKKPWITDDTLKLVDEKHRLEHAGDQQKYKDACKIAKKAIKKDWETWLHTITNEELDIRDKWLGIKFLKKNHQPRLYEKADASKNVLEFHKLANAAAVFLEQKQWAPLPEEENSLVPTSRKRRPSSGRQLDRTETNGIAVDSR